MVVLVQTKLMLLAKDLHNWHDILHSKMLLEQLMAATSGSNHWALIKMTTLITDSYIAYKCRQFVIQQASFLIFLWATQDLFTPVLLKQQCTAMLSILHLVTFFKVIMGTDKPIQVFTPLKMPYKDQWRRVPFTIIE